MRATLGSLLLSRANCSRSCHLFYPALRAIRFPCLPFLGFATTVFVCAFSCWLGYTLFFVLNDFCVVCVSTYVCNFACLPVMYAILRTRDAPQNESFELDATINVVWVLLMLINAVLRLIQLPWRLLTAAYELLTRGQQDPPAEVVIVGASFAGLACFRELSGRRDCKVRRSAWASQRLWPTALANASDQRLLPTPLANASDQRLLPTPLANAPGQRPSSRGLRLGLSHPAAPASASVRPTCAVSAGDPGRLQGVL